MKTPPKKSQEWEQKFDKLFTTISKGGDDKGEFKDNWFIEYITAKDIKNFIRTELANALREENEAWRRRERCSICGEPMKPQPTTDTCFKCFQEE